MSKLVVKILRYTSTKLSSLIGKIDKGKSVESDSLYRIELKFFLEKYFPLLNGEVLDLGAGDWLWTREQLVKKTDCVLVTFDNRNVVGVDVVGDLYELDKYFKEGSFDAVICTDVIEHVANPFEAISNISFALKKGGLVLFSCPFNKNLHGEEYGDYWRITRQGWKELLRKDFTEIEIDWFGQELLPKAYFIKARKI